MYMFRGVPKSVLRSGAYARLLSCKLSDLYEIAQLGVTQLWIGDCMSVCVPDADAHGRVAMIMYLPAGTYQVPVAWFRVPTKSGVTAELANSGVTPDSFFWFDGELQSVYFTVK